MTKAEYIKQLGNKLNKLPREEMLEAISYYSEYFDEAGPENEQEIINKLGSPDKVAKQIISECAIKSIEEPKKTVKGGLDTVWIVILAIFAAPIAFPLAIAFVSVIFALSVTVIAVTGSVVFSGIVFAGGGIISIIAGMFVLFVHPVSGCMALGIGFVMVSLGILIFLLGTALARLLFLGIAKLFKSVIKK